MYFNGLIEHSPETIYVNCEQSKKVPTKSSLAQKRIDAAFKRKPRSSNYIFTYEDNKIYLLNGKNTNNLGVEEKEISNKEKISVTNLERTLIDITVRPVYSGSVKEILNAYRKSKNKVSIANLAKILKRIDYVYPYHQSIGYYLQRAEYDDLCLNLFKENIKYKFFLDYNMTKPNFSKEWKVFYPNNL